MNQIKIDNYTRISKQAARARHNAGQPCYAIPCKLHPENMWQRPAPVPVYEPQGATFDEWLNAFEYYNCDAERGRYTAFYVMGCDPA